MDKNGHFALQMVMEMHHTREVCALELPMKEQGKKQEIETFLLLQVFQILVNFLADFRILQL